MNIYDVTGNLVEWSIETAYNKNLTYSGNINYNTYILRGAALDSTHTNIPACFRSGTYALNAGTHFGFRPALLLQ